MNPRVLYWVSRRRLGVNLDVYTIAGLEQRLAAVSRGRLPGRIGRELAVLPRDLIRRVVLRRDRHRKPTGDHLRQVG